MRLTTLRALAFACACTWAANAGAGGAQSDADWSVEVETPVTVNESAPWLAGKPHVGDGALAPEALPANRDNVDAASDSNPLAANEATEYWMIGSEDAKPSVGASASGGAGGSVSFDSGTRRSGG